jgi:hypothetical protein
LGGVVNLHVFLMKALNLASQSNVSFKCGRGPTTTSHLDACTSMKHAHQSYAHVVLQMSLTYWSSLSQNFMPKWTTPDVQSLSLWPKQMNLTWSGLRLSLPQ